MITKKLMRIIRFAGLDEYNPEPLMDAKLLRAIDEAILGYEDSFDQIAEAVARFDLDAVARIVRSRHGEHLKVQGLPAHNEIDLLRPDTFWALARTLYEARFEEIEPRNVARAQGSDLERAVIVEWRAMLPRGRLFYSASVGGVTTRKAFYAAVARVLRAIADELEADNPWVDP